MNKFIQKHNIKPQQWYSSTSNDNNTDSDNVHDSLYKSYWDNLVIQNGDGWDDKLTQSIKQKKQETLSVSGQ